MTRERYEQCLRENRPYFGVYLAATQGHPVRHAYMRYLVACEVHRRGIQPLRILEIGSWAGGSAITWAEALREFNAGQGSVVCVDPWQPYEMLTAQPIGGVMQSALQTGEIFKLFMHNMASSGLAQLVTAMRGPSRDILPTLTPASCQIVYVDGSHAYQDVLDDLRLSTPLLAQGGILCGDDLELQAHEVDQDFMRVNCATDYLPDPKSGQEYHPGVTRAVGDYLGPVSCWAGFWAARRVGDSWHPVELWQLPGVELRIPGHLMGA